MSSQSAVPYNLGCPYYQQKLCDTRQQLHYLCMAWIPMYAKLDYLFSFGFSNPDLCANETTPLRVNGLKAIPDFLNQLVLLDFLPDRTALVKWGIFQGHFHSGRISDLFLLGQKGQSWSLFEQKWKVSCARHQRDSVRQSRANRK